MHDFGLWEDARVTGEKTGTERSCKLNVDMIPSLTFLLWGGGANCSATLMPVMYFYNFIKMLIEICGSLRGCASPESHWPTTKPVLLNDGSIMLSTASPDLFTSVGGADSKPALICEKDNSGGPTNSSHESIQMFCFCFFLFVTELMHKLICFAVTFANN